MVKEFTPLATHSPPHGIQEYRHQFFHESTSHFTSNRTNQTLCFLPKPPTITATSVKGNSHLYRYARQTSASLLTLLSLTPNIQSIGKSCQDCLCLYSQNPPLDISKKTREKATAMIPLMEFGRPAPTACSTPT